MSVNNVLSDTDLKTKLARYGIVAPITNTTRSVLLKKLQKLETGSINQQYQQITSNDTESMVIKFLLRIQNIKNYISYLIKATSRFLVKYQ